MLWLEFEAYAYVHIGTRVLNVQTYSGYLTHQNLNIICRDTSQSQKSFIILVPEDRGLANGVPEEKCLDSRRPDHPEKRDREQQSAESCWLSRITIANVISQNTLRLNLTQLN